MPLDLAAQITADESGVFLPNDGSGFDVGVTGPDGAIRGAFTDESYEGDRGGPWCWIRDSDIGTITHGSTVTIGGVVFTVDGLQAGGYGFTRLLLEQPTP